MPTDLDTRRLLYKIAKAYYDHGLTQEQIGRRFGLSRIKVSRLLGRAREEKIVLISVVPPQASNAELEQELEARYGLDEAIVVSPLSEAPAALARELGAPTVDCLLRCLQSDSVLGLTWGTALLAVVDALVAAHYPGVTVVQLLGGLGRPEAEVYGSDLARRMAEALGAKLRLLPAPGIVHSKLVRDALLTDPQIVDTLALGAEADIAVAGIGRPAPGSVVEEAGILSSEELDQLQALGAVGDIALRFFDAQGRKVEHEIDERIIGLDLEQIRRIPRVIGVAGGLAKVAVIRAALRGRLVDVLVTDKTVARRLLAEQG